MLFICLFISISSGPCLFTKFTIIDGKFYILHFPVLRYLFTLNLSFLWHTPRMRLNNPIYKNRIILKILKYPNLIICISLVFLSALGKSGKIPKVIILIQHEPQVCCIHWGVPTWIHDKNFWPIVCVSVSVSVWVWCICVRHVRVCHSWHMKYT